jgi:tight adherence protein C
MNLSSATLTVPFTIPLDSSVLLVIISVLVGLAVAFVLIGVFQPSSNPMRGRLAKLASERPVAPTLEELELQQPFYDRAIKPLIIQLSRTVTRMTPGTQVDNIQLKLAQAGNPRNLTVEGFFGLKAVLAVVVGALIALFFWLLPPLIAAPDALHFTLYIVLALVAGYFLPDLWLMDETRKRRKKIQRALPDTIDILSISVEAGLAFDAAIARMVAKSEGPLIDEFEKYLLEVRLGKPRRDSLRLVIVRCGVEDVNTFIGSILQADQLGVSISNVLRAQSEAMRVRRRQRAQTLAQQAPLKMLFPMILFIFPSVFVVILGPAIPQIMGAFGG